MYDFNMRRHIILSCKLFETERTGIDLDITLVGGDIVTTEIAYVGIDARANLTTVRVFTLFGTVITYGALTFALNNGITRCIQFGFGWW